MKSKLIRSWLELGMLIGIASLGAILFMTAELLGTWQSPQVRFYNQGLHLYEQAQTDPTKLDAALLAFDQSLDQYRLFQKRGVQSAIYPVPSSEIAALALSKKAVLFLLKQKADAAVEAFKESISINSGSIDPDLIAQTMVYEELSQDDVARLAAQAQVAIHNLEMLFHQQPSLQKQQGKNQGQGSGSDPTQAPGSKPAPGAGKSGNPNAI